MKDPRDAPLTVGDFAVVMNTVLIEIYADLGPEHLESKVTDLAKRLHEVGMRVSDSPRKVAVLTLADVLMRTKLAPEFRAVAAARRDSSGTP